MLVHPVGAVAPDDAVVPPRLGGDLASPGQRRVPIITQVVVVEQHPGWHRRQQPPNRRRRPRLVVEPGVLLEVLDLVDDVRARVVVDVAGVGRRSRREVRRRTPGRRSTTVRRQRVVRRLGHLCGQRGEGVSTDDGEVLLVEGIGSATAPEPRRNGASGSMARMTLGGNSDPSGGHTWWPSSLTEYSFAVHGARRSMWTSA